LLGETGCRMQGILSACVPAGQICASANCRTSGQSIQSWVHMFTVCIGTHSIKSGGSGCPLILAAHISMLRSLSVRLVEGLVWYPYVGQRIHSWVHVFHMNRLHRCALVEEWMEQDVQDVLALRLSITPGGSEWRRLRPGCASQATSAICPGESRCGWAGCASIGSSGAAKRDVPPACGTTLASLAAATLVRACTCALKS